jgi:hypothetical protein
MKTEDRSRQIQRVSEVLKDLLDRLELQAEIKTADQYSETIPPELVIASDTLPMFKATIGGCYSKDTHLKIWLSDRYRRVLKRHDSIACDSLIYEFCHMLPDTELEKLGVPKIAYSRTLRPFMIEFKADKNPKLIVRDVESSLVVYKKLVEAVAEPIQKRIAQEDATVKLLNQVSKACGYWKNFNVPERCTFRHETIGQIIVYEYGTIEVTSEVSPDVLLGMLEHAKVEKAINQAISK